jgi:hypothetical protein
VAGPDGANPNGDPVTLRMTATDNIALATIGLILDSTAVDLDAVGSATLTFDAVAVMNAVVTAENTSGNTARNELELRIIDPTDVEGPVVDITSPDFDPVVTAPIDVLGTPSDSNLVFYKFEIAPVTGGEFVEIARSSTPVTGGSGGLCRVKTIFSQFLDESSLFSCQLVHNALRLFFLCFVCFDECLDSRSGPFRQVRPEFDNLVQIGIFLRDLRQPGRRDRYRSFFKRLI